MPTLKFRPGTPKDASAIAEIHCRSWQLTYRGDFSDEYLDHRAPAERLAVWQERLRVVRPDMLLELARTEDQTVGFSCVFLDNHAKFGHLLDNLHVRPGYYGRGIGETLILRSMKRVAALRGAEAPYFLWVLETNERAIQFYERLGGRPGVRELHHFPGGNEVWAISYHWRVTQ